MDSQLVGLLLLTALNVGAAVVSVSACRRASSFDITRDFDSLCTAVSRLQAVGRSEKMQRVRAGLPAPAAPAAPADVRLSHDQLRALVRAKNGATSQ